MMKYFRMFLIELRKRENEERKIPLSVILASSGVISLIIGFLLDKFIPFNFLTNIVRGIFANIAGATLFSFSYLMSIKFSRQRLLKDRYYKTFRKRLSHRQRTNLSIFLGILIAFFILLGGKYSLVFTFKSAFAIFAALVLIAFTRRNRDEFIKNVYNVPDLRDLETMQERHKKKEKKKKEKKK